MYMYIMYMYNSLNILSLENKDYYSKGKCYSNSNFGISAVSIRSVFYTFRKYTAQYRR